MTGGASSPLIVPGRTQPEPDPESEKEVREILKGIDPLLDLKWLPLCRVGPGGSLEGRYALTCQWAQEDPRWELYRSGEIGEPFDILGYFEAQDGEMDWFSGAQNGARPVDPLEVVEQVRELLGRCDGTRQSPLERLERNAARNKALREKRRADVVDETVQGMKSHRRQVQGLPLVSGEDLTTEEDQ